MVYSLSFNNECDFVAFRINNVKVVPFWEIFGNN